MDYTDLFQRFWWLIFPVMGMTMGMLNQWGQHKQAQKGMELIKSYIDQGKEPPPELIKLLSADTNCNKSRGGSWTPVFLFAVLAGAFVWAAYWPGMDFEPKQLWVVHVVAMIFGALCLGCLVSALRHDRDRKQK